MNRLTVVTWNAEGMFVDDTKTRRGTPHDAIATLRKLDADIVVIPEFGRMADLQDAHAAAIEALGYEITLVAYDEPRAPGLGFAILSRLPILETRVHELPGSRRQVVEIQHKDVEGTRIRVLGVHLDDRSEAGRLTEIATVCDIVTTEATMPTLLLGDFNAMHHDSWFARIARSRPAHGLSRRVRHTLVRSMADRVHEMALGTTVEYLLAHTNLHDLDPGRKRTISGKQAGLEWLPAWRLAKIDWIFGSKQFKTVGYRVLRDSGSDHRPVRAELEY
jgi:endonuclease/exonuclease/phosphatase family metal-dependent hydrolase